jgi:hypothetical protein
MTDLRQAAQQAFDALDSVCNDQLCAVLHHRRNEYHAIGEECPALKRLCSARDNLRTALAALQPEPEPITHKHEWFRTGAMAHGVCRCIHCGKWNHEIDAQHGEIEQLKAERDALLEALEAMTDAFLDTEGKHGTVESDAMKKAYAAIDAARGDK